MSAEAAVAAVLVDVKYIAKMLNVSVSWVHWAKDQGIIPFIRVGPKMVRFDPVMVRAAIDQMQQRTSVVVPLRPR